jgi:hypothetical protein
MNAAWAKYQQTDDKGTFATSHALFFRSIFVTALTIALDRTDCGPQAFSNRDRTRKTGRIVVRPMPSHVAALQPL